MGPTLLRPAYLLPRSDADDFHGDGSSHTFISVVPSTVDEARRWISIIPTTSSLWRSVRPYRVVYSGPLRLGQAEPVRIRVQAVVGLSRLEPSGVDSRCALFLLLFFLF